MRYRLAALFTMILVAGFAQGQPAGKLEVLKDGKLGLRIPTTWKRAVKNSGGDGVLGAYQSEDNTSGLFVSTVTTRPDYGLPRVMDGVVRNFEEGLIVNHIGKYKEGKIAGVSAVFCTLELDLPSASSRGRMPFRFYLTLFETGGVVYLIQGSVQKPIKPEREREILAIIRSVAKAG